MKKILENSPQNLKVYESKKEWRKTIVQVKRGGATWV